MAVFNSKQKKLWNSDRTNIQDPFYQIIAGVENSLKTNAVPWQSEFEATILHVSSLFKDPLNYESIYETLGSENPFIYRRIYFRIAPANLNVGLESAIPLPPTFEAVYKANISRDENAKDFIKPRQTKFKEGPWADALYNACASNCIWAQTTEAAAAGGWTPKTGDRIMVRFGDPYGLTDPLFVRVIETGENNVPVARMPSVASAFNNLNNMIYSSVESPLTLANSYDSDDTVPQKSQHKRFLDIAHPEFVPYIKAFIYKSWAELGASIKLNSSYRSPLKQKQLYDEWVASDQTGIKPARPGTSWHNVGSAIDFNPSLADGKRLSSRSPKSEWLTSKIPEIGESVGLRWGGHFSSNYDPIHFDIGNKLPLSKRSRMIQAASDAGKPVLEIPFP